MISQNHQMTQRFHFDMQLFKICKGCFRFKSISQFYKHSMMTGGYLNYCKSCVCRRIKFYRINNTEEIRKKDRERYRGKKKTNQGYMLNKNEYMRNWRSPQKTKAHNITARKLRKNKPPKCEFCNREKEPLAHHPDYNNPFEVNWICTFCHSLVRRRNNARNSL